MSEDSEGEAVIDIVSEMAEIAVKRLFLNKKETELLIAELFSILIKIGEDRCH